MGLGTLGESGLAGRIESRMGMYQGWRGLGARRIKVTRTTLGVGVTCVSRFQDGYITHTLPLPAAHSPTPVTLLLLQAYLGLLIRRPRYSRKESRHSDSGDSKSHTPCPLPRLLVFGGGGQYWSPRYERVRGPLWNGWDHSMFNQLMDIDVCPLCLGRTGERTIWSALRGRTTYVIQLIEDAVRRTDCFNRTS